MLEMPEELAAKVFNIELDTTGHIDEPIRKPLWQPSRKKETPQVMPQQLTKDYIKRDNGTTPGSQERIALLQRFYAREEKLNGPLYDDKTGHRAGISAFSNNLVEQFYDLCTTCGESLNHLFPEE